MKHSIAIHCDRQPNREQVERAISWALTILTIAYLLLTAFAPELALAGTSDTFDALEGETKASVYGPLGKSAIYIAALGGAFWAAVKGAWAMAGMGMGVAGLMYGTELVTDSSTFSALI